MIVDGAVADVDVVEAAAPGGVEQRGVTQWIGGGGRELPRGSDVVVQGVVVQLHLQALASQVAGFVCGDAVSDAPVEPHAVEVAVGGGRGPAGGGGAVVGDRPGPQGVSVLPQARQVAVLRLRDGGLVRRPDFQSPARRRMPRIALMRREGHVVVAVGGRGEGGARPVGSVDGVGAVGDPVAGRVVDAHDARLGERARVGFEGKEVGDAGLEGDPHPVDVVVSESVVDAVPVVG